jgi:DHA2 family multidrug resistance protein-like MFS transporter
MNVSTNRRWWALGALTLAVLAVSLDGTILSVALPTLAGRLHASESDLQWFQSGYLLVLAAAMLPAGLLGDRFGRRRVMVLSLLLFGAGSVACAYSPSPGAFISARVLLGLAGAGIIVMALSALTVLFTKEERPKAVGVWAAANFVALPIGPILGGWLLTNYWWGWVFLINAPVVLVGIGATLALLPESRAPERPGLDPLGMLASMAGLVGVTYGVIRAGEHGWGDAAAITLMVAGVLVIVAFFGWERAVSRRANGQPLVDLSLFGSASFTWGVILAAVGVLAMIGVLFTMPQYFQGVRGTDAMGSGVRLLPLVGGLILGALPADNVARLVGAKITVTLGFLILGAGLTLGAATTVGSSTAFIALWMALVGAGMGLSMATASSAALVEVPEGRSGVAAAVMQALQKTGGPFGAAVLGSLLSSAYRSRLDLRGLTPPAAHAVRSSVFAGVEVAHNTGSAPLLDSVRVAFAHGMDVSLLASAGIAVAGAALALLFLPARAVPVPPTDTAAERAHVAAG